MPSDSQRPGRRDRNLSSPIAPAAAAATAAAPAPGACKPVRLALKSSVWLPFEQMPICPRSLGIFTSVLFPSRRHARESLTLRVSPAFSLPGHEAQTGRNGWAILCAQIFHKKNLATFPRRSPLPRQGYPRLPHPASRLFSVSAGLWNAFQIESGSRRFAIAPVRLPKIRRKGRLWDPRRKVPTGDGDRPALDYDAPARWPARLIARPRFFSASRQN